MTLKILFKDGTEQAVTIYKDESVKRVIADVCRMNRWDATLISDYWIER